MHLPVRRCRDAERLATRLRSRCRGTASKIRWRTGGGGPLPAAGSCRCGASPPAAMMSPNFVLVLFALLATAGAYWIAAARRGPLAGLGAALLALLFFAAIFAGLAALVRSGGVR